MEKTFIILKPDAMEKRLVGTIVARFEAAGFDVVACKMGRLSPALLREHYAHVASKPFYPEIEAFMSRRPVVLVALQGENVVQRVRDLLGPTDSRKAPQGYDSRGLRHRYDGQRCPRIRQRGERAG